MSLIFSDAHAEALEAQFSRISESSGCFDISKFIQGLLSGESLINLVPAEQIPALIKRYLLQGLSAVNLNLALPVLMCMVMRMTTGNTGMDYMLDLLCALCCGKSLIQLWLGAQSEAGTLIDGILRTNEEMTPLMVSAAALTGGALWSSAIVPLSNLCTSFIQRILRDWGFQLCNIATAIALSCAIAGRYALNKLFDLLKSTVHGLLGIAVFLYGGLISAQGLICTVKDGMAMRTAKIAMETLIPIIGGGISSSAGALTVSVGLARSAVGITGVVLIVRTCARPLIKLAGQMLSLKLLSAAMEPLAAGTAAELIAHFGDVLETLLALTVGCVAMAAMIPAAFALLAGGAL